MKKKPKLVLHNLVEKRGDFYRGVCIELKVAARGKSAKEAEARLEAVAKRMITAFRNSGDESQLKIRLAPMELWIRYFKLGLKEHEKELRRNPSSVIEFANCIA